ncbi:MAG TPA: hypothetical protein VNF73_03455 [Candidatus Saccharimonadales bacterium]|nr:hypothetical protein [Candidatus Saccharimonadales bacterium]
MAASYRGRGTVSFGAAPLSNFTALAPQAYRGAYFDESSFREGYGRIVYDYLADHPADAEHGR